MATVGLSRDDDVSMEMLLRQDINNTEELVIYPNNKQFGSAHIEQLCKYALEKNKYLKAINCSGYEIRPTALYQIGRAVTKNGNIERITLANAEMGDYGLLAFVQGLLLLPYSQSFKDINDLTCTDDSDVLIPFTEINLSNNRFSQLGFATIIKLAQHCTDLQILNISHNPMIGVGVTKPIFGLNNNTYCAIFCTVQQLDMSDCGIDSKFAKQLFTCLVLGRGSTSPATPTANAPLVLESLKLSNNVSFGDFGFRLLIQSELPLRKLYLSNCNLTDKSLEYLVMKRIFLHWKVLDLSNNTNITSQGGKHIAYCFQMLQKQGRNDPDQWTFPNKLGNLLELNLSGNVQLGYAGCIPIVQSIRDGVLLESLDCSQTNCCIDTVTVAISISSASHNNLRHLYFRDNQLGLLRESFSRGEDGSWSSRVTSGLDHIIGNMGLVSQNLHTLDLSRNSADEHSIVAMLKALLQSLQHQDTKTSQGISLTRLLICGNPGSCTEKVDNLVQQIQRIRPQLTIKRDILQV